MSKLLLVGLLAFVVLVVAEHPAQTFIVNLDAPPAQRWPWEQLQPYNASVWKALGLIKDFVPSYLINVLEDVMADVGSSGLLGDYGIEMKSGADYIGIPYGAAVLLNLIYEVEAGCTSIVTSLPDGTIVHGRNLDFNLHSVLQDLAVNVEFQKGGKTVYSGTTFVGYVGLLTGCNGVFCVTVDERDTGYIWENLLEAVFEDGKVSALLIRDMLASSSTFEQAIQVFNSTKLIAPVYYIVSGTQAGEGAIITRDRNDGNVRRLGDSKQGDGSWYVCETNYDWWQPDGDGRRTVAEKMMNQYGAANMTLQNIYNVLSTNPVLNKDTTYTVVMSAQTGYYNTTVRGSN